MNANEYQKAATRTESVIDEGTFNKRCRLQLVDALAIMLHSGNLLDGHKRVLFYDKPPKPNIHDALFNIAVECENARRFDVTTPQYVDIDPRIAHGIIGVCTEAGELAEALYDVIEAGRGIDRTNVIEECGDVLWYIACLLDAVGCDMETAMDANIAKLRARYPEKFDGDAAVERNVEVEIGAIETVTGGAK